MIAKELAIAMVAGVALIALTVSVFGKDEYRVYHILVSIHFQLWALFFLLKF